MKILFLDIDGVLNNPSTYMAAHKNKSTNDADLLDDAMCKLLASIVQQTGCSIVISSTWRVLYHGKLPELYKLISTKAGMDLPFIGCTPHISGHVERGKEIEEWLKVNNFTGRMIILDDDDDMGALKSCLIQTKGRTGLTQKEAEEAVKLLNASIP